MAKTVQAPQGEPVAFVEITKVVRVREPMFHDQGGGTMGQAIDRFLEQCASQGDEVQSIKLDIEEDYWQNIVHQMKPSPHTEDGWATEVAYEPGSDARKAKPRY